ncbi:unnamed protein product [Cunninghamella blakesleeana]
MNHYSPSNAFYHPTSPPPRQHRIRTQSNPTKTSVQPQKSSSTPNSPHQYTRKKLTPNSHHRNNHHTTTTTTTNNNNNNMNHNRPKSTIIQENNHYPTSKSSSSFTASRSISPSTNGSSSIHSTNSSIISKTPSIDSSNGRRSSITSTSSNVSQAVSIRSEFSMNGNAKLSLSKRLKKAFSISNLRSSSSSSLSSSPSKHSLGSLDGACSSNVSINTIDVIPEHSMSIQPQKNLRRRSFASLSTLFQKNNKQQLVSPISTPPNLSPSTSQSTNTTRRPSITPSLNQQQQENKKDRPHLRVDTSRPVISSNQRKNVTPIKGRSSIIAPDSPNSSKSTRSPVTRVIGPHRLASELPSPTPSASSSTSSQNPNNNEIDLSMAPPPVIGVHYGLPMHGSPRLKPAASSSASSLIMNDTSSIASNSLSNVNNNSNNGGKRGRLQFCPTVQVHETFAASDYDRRCDNNSTCQKLTPMIAMKIKQELNEYKLTEMEVHVDSRQYTHFFL